MYYVFTLHFIIPFHGWQVCIGLVHILYFLVPDFSPVTHCSSTHFVKCCPVLENNALSYSPADKQVEKAASLQAGGTTMLPEDPFGSVPFVANAGKF